MSLKQDLIRKFTPFAFRELLRFFYYKSFFTKSEEELKALDFSTRTVLKKMLDAYRFPEKTPWITLFVPSELLYAMNLNAICLEVSASLFSKIGQSQSALLEAEAHGIPTDGCSFHRAALGYVYKNFFPKTKFLATTTTLCDSNPKTIGISQSVNGGESSVLDVPYDLNDESVNYLARQLRDFTKDLESAYGITMKEDSFKEAIKCANRTREKMIEVNELRVDPHSPLEGSQALGLIVPSHLLCGSKEGEIFYDMLVKDLQNGISESKNKGKHHRNEKLRVLWLELKPYFENTLLTDMEEKLGIKIVFEEINHVFWDEMDPDTPYESLARKIISNHNNGPLENRIEVLNMLADKYDIDGVMMFASWGCRRNGAAVPAIKQEFSKRGIPSLILHGDCVDDSTYTEGQFSTRIEGFVEMLRKKRPLPV